MNLDEIRSRVESLGFRTSNQVDGFRSRCPCCKTSRPDKLSVTTADDGKILLKCFGDCKVADIVEAVGLEPRDLFSGNGSLSGVPNGPKLHDTKDDAAKAMRWSLEKRGYTNIREAGRWTYHDNCGEHVANVIRFDYEGGKTYCQMRRVNGKWQNKGPEHRILYRLPEIAEHDEIWLFEGEKCADIGWSIGLPSTTTLGGCKQAHLADFTPLSGKARVTISPDTGGDGERLLKDCVAAISKLDDPPVLRVCPMPFDEPNLDIADWLEGVGTDDAEGIRASLEQLCEPIEIGDFLQDDPNNDARPDDQDGGQRRVQYNVLTSAELNAGDYTIQYLIERTLVADQPCIVAGSTKTLKTSLMIDMGITLATGGFFLGKLPATRSCRVMIMSGESGLGTVQETARRIATAAGHRLENLKNLLWSTDLPKFGHLEHMEALRELLADRAIEVLIIDPAYLCMPSRDAGNRMAQGALLGSMNEVCGKAGATLVVAHHNSQQGQRTRGFEPPELEDIAWAGFQEWARQWLLVGRRERYELGSNLHRLWFSVGGSAGHSALWALDIDENGPDVHTRGWAVEMLTGREAREEAAEDTERKKRRQQEANEGEDKRKLWEVVQEYPDGETFTQLRDEAGLNAPRARRAMFLLDKEGRVEKCGVRKGNNRGYEGFKPAARFASGRNGTSNGTNVSQCESHATGQGTT